MKPSTLFSLFRGLIFVPMLLQAGSLHGKVIDAVSKQAVVGASLKLDIVIPDSVALFAASDTAGNFTISGILSDNSIYALSCYKSGYVGFHVRLDDVGMGDHVYNVELEPEGASPPPPGADSTLVIGLVQGRANDGSVIGIGGAQVTIIRSGGQNILTADSHGRFISVGAGAISQIDYSAQGFVGRTISQLGISGNIVTLASVLSLSVVNVPPPEVPESMMLLETYPNPFNPSTTVAFSVSREEYVKLAVFDALGRSIRTLFEGIASAGRHKVTFEAGGLASGVYLFNLIAENGVTLSAKAVLSR